MKKRREERRGYDFVEQATTQAYSSPNNLTGIYIRHHKEEQGPWQHASNIEDQAPSNKSPLPSSCCFLPASLWLALSQGNPICFLFRWSLCSSTRSIPRPVCCVENMIPHPAGVILQDPPSRHESDWQWATQPAGQKKKKKNTYKPKGESATNSWINLPKINL